MDNSIYHKNEGRTSISFLLKIVQSENPNYPPHLFYYVHFTNSKSIGREIY